MATTGDPQPDPPLLPARSELAVTPAPIDQLDVLAAEVGVDVEQELEREGLLGKLRSGAGAVARVPVRTRDKVAELVDTALDRVYAAPLDVSTAAEAVAMLDELSDDPTGKETTRRIATALAAAGPVVARLAKGTGVVAKVAGVGTKFLPAGRAVALGTTAVLATVRIGASASVGVRELQVLASYLVARHRAAGLLVDRDLVEQVTVQAYLDPTARIRLEPGTRRGYSRLARAWTGRSFRSPSAKKRQQLHRRRVTAIEALDLHGLTAAWVTAGGSPGRPAPPPRTVTAPPPAPPWVTPS